MIIVVLDDDTQHEFQSVRFVTDEHNNLCIEDADERLIRLFRNGVWREVHGVDSA